MPRRAFFALFPVAAILSVVLLAAACSPRTPPSAPPPTIDGATAFRHAAAVYGLGPKFSGSPGALATVEYLRREITALGLTPTVDEWTENTAVGPVIFRNVSVDIAGARPGPFILVGCHYDTKRMQSMPDFAGANDGASGVGALLAMMQAVAALPDPPPCTLRFLFFDGEECLHEYGPNDGLHGSRRHAAQLQAEGRIDRILAVLLLDMIGDRDLTFTIPDGAHPHLVRILRDVATRAGQEHRLKPFGADILDDHTPFQRLGVPTLALIDFEYGPGNRYWHSPGDTLDKISPESLAVAADLTLAIAWELPSLRNFPATR
jgi:Zn-dependent M28 family amino/carboxypeptidase